MNQHRAHSLRPISATSDRGPRFASQIIRERRLDLAEQRYLRRARKADAIFGLVAIAFALIVTAPWLMLALQVTAW